MAQKTRPRRSTRSAQKQSKKSTSRHRPRGERKTTAKRARTRNHPPRKARARPARLPEPVKPQPSAPPPERAAAPECPPSSAPTTLAPALSLGPTRRAAKRRRLLDVTRHLSVEDAARVLRVCKSTVRNMLLRGDMHCIQGRTPIRFTREEVLRVAALIGIEVKTIPTDGDVAAQAFRAFKEGRSVRDVVIECKISPDHAEQLLQRYATMGADTVFPGEVATQIQALGFFQNRAVDPRELPQIMSDLLAFCEQVDPEAQAARAAWNQPPKPGTSS